MARQSGSAGVSFLRHGSGHVGNLGLLLAGVLAALAALLMPRLPEDWHARVLAPGWLPSQLVRILEYSNDIQVALVADRPPLPHPRIALIMITDDTLADLAYISPIDRGLIARIVKALDGLGARVIGLDLLFDQPTEADKDALLLETFRFTRASLVLGGADERSALSPRRRQWQSAFLARAGQPFGFFNLRYDVREAAATHVVRNRAAAHAGSQFKMSFAEALARRAGAAEMMNGRRIPWLRAPESGADTFISLDADAVLAADQDPDGVMARALEQQLHGRVVLVGADLEGRDRHPTPLSLVTGEDLLGVSIHAQILAGLLDRRTLSDLEVPAVAALGGIAAFLGTLIGWFAARSRLVLTLLVSCGTLFVMALSAFVLWQFKAIVPVAAIVATLVGAAMAGRLARGYAEV